MNKKIALMVFLVLTLSACGNPAHTAEDLLYCNEGDYSVPDHMQKQAELSDMEIDRLTIVKEGDLCMVYMRLAEPKTIMGTEIQTWPALKCSYKFAQNSVEEGRFDVETAADKYCFPA